MAPRKEGKTVQLALSPDEALVLHDWLSRMSDSEELRFEHPAEQRVLWDIECDLETKLVEPFMPTYGDLVRKARDAIGSKDEAV